MQHTVLAFSVATLAACSSMGWNKESSQGSTHTMTGGAEAAPTDQATPQPAGPKGSSQGGTQGGAAGASSSGNATTGGAEGAPTSESAPGTGGTATPAE